jgi:hypothetical protein
MSFQPGAVLEDAKWQAPAYCFTKDDTDTGNKSLISEPEEHDDDDDDESFVPKMRMLRGG